MSLPLQLCELSGMDKKQNKTTNEFKINSTNIYKDKYPAVQLKEDENLTQKKSVQLENNNVVSLIPTSNGKRKYSSIYEEASNNKQRRNPNTGLLGSNLSCVANEVEKNASFMSLSENFKMDFSSKSGFVRVYGRESSSNGVISEKNIGESFVSSLVQATCDESEKSTECNTRRSFNEDTKNILGSEKGIKKHRFGSKNNFKYSKSDIFPKNKESDKEARQMADGKVLSRAASRVSFRKDEMVDREIEIVYSPDNANAVPGPSGIRPDLHQKGSKYGFACNLCGKEFVESWEFDIHYQKHTKEKAFVGDERNRKFTQNEDVDRNYRAHTREKPYASKVCKKEFTQQRNVKDNCRPHTGKNLFKCNVCTFIFRKQSDLDNHYRTYHC